MSFATSFSKVIVSRSQVAQKTLLASWINVRSLKETHLHNPNSALEYENLKRDNLKKQSEGKGQWEPKLASDSEEALTADRNHQGESIKELQEMTVTHVEDVRLKKTSHSRGH